MTRSDTITIRRLTKDRRSLLKYILKASNNDVPDDPRLDAMDVNLVIDAVASGVPIADFDALRTKAPEVVLFSVVPTTSSPDTSPELTPKSSLSDSSSWSAPLTPRLPADPVHLTAISSLPAPSSSQTEPLPEMIENVSEPQQDAILRQRSAVLVPAPSFSMPVPPAELLAPAPAASTAQSVPAPATPSTPPTPPAALAAPAASPCSSPVQELPAMSTGLSPEQQRLLAFTFLYACSHQDSTYGPSHPLLRQLLTSLRVPPAQALAVARHLSHMEAAYQAALAGVSTSRTSPLAAPNMLLLLMLLERMRLEDFNGDVAALLAWQQAMADVLLACSRPARRTSRAAQEQAVGRLQEQVAQLATGQASQEEHAAAVSRLRQQVQAALSALGAGYSLPRPVQLQLCCLLEACALSMEATEATATSSSEEQAGSSSPAQKMLAQLLWQRPAPLESFELGDMPLGSCRALVLLRSYQESPRAGLLPRLRQQLVLVAHCLQRLSFTSPGNKQLAAQVAGEVHALMQERLALHLGVPAQQQRQMRREPLPLLLQLLQLSGRIAGQHNDCSVLPGLVKVSVHSSWAYDVQQLQDSGATLSDSLSLLGQNLRHRLKELGSLADQVGALAPHLPDLAEVAALEYYKLYGEQLAAWADEVNGRVGSRAAEGQAWVLVHDEEAIKVIREAVDMESLLEGCAGYCDPSLRWRLQRLLEPALNHVVTVRHEILQASYQRLVSSEECLWQRVSSEVAYSVAALELERMVRASLEVLLKLQEDLGLPLPWSVVSTHLQNIEGLLEEYARFVMDTLRQASAEDELMPRSAPQPQLYSAEQSRRLAERELGPQGAGRDVTCLLDSEGQLAEGVLSSVPRRRAAPRLQALTTEKLCILLESVWHLHRLCHNQAQNMALGQQQHSHSYHQQHQQHQQRAWQASRRAENSFVQQLRSEWFSEGVEEASSAGLRSKLSSLSASTRTMGAQVLDNALEVARDKLGEAAQQVAAFLATKLVLWDQRALWLELLLRHPERGSPSRLQLPLKALLLSQASWPLPAGCQTLEGMLMELFRTLRTRELRAEVLPQALLRAVCAAVERVLLQGGPARAFTPACVERLSADLGLLQDMLLTVSRGSADFREVLALEMGRLDKILAAMRLPSAQLLQQLEAASGQEQELLLRVALHRADEQVAASLKVRCSFGYFDLRVPAVKDVVLSRLPAWFTGAAWSRRGRQ